MRYDAVLYDLDGTLIDTVPSILKAFQRTFSEVLGEPGDEEYILSTIGRPLSEAFYPFEKSVQSELFEKCKVYSDEYLRTMAVVFPGITEDLRQLQEKGVRQGVVTSKRKAAADFSISHFGLENIFETVVVKEDTQKYKPFPEPIFEGMKRLGIKDPSRILYVGDSIHDVKCAHHAGVDCAVVDWTYMPKEEMRRENPRYWIKRIGEISCILSGGEL